MGSASGLPYFFAIISTVRLRVTCWGLALFYVVLPSQDQLSARTAAVAADVHVAIKLALFVAAAIAVLALVTCDLRVEQWQPHL